ncbi:MAG: hypothetical protein ACEQSB_06695 [Undibacterium sp.]
MKPIRDALVEKAAQIQRSADSEKRRAETFALQALTGEGDDDGNAKWNAIEAHGASKAYAFCRRKIDQLINEFEAGDIG